MTTCLSSIIGGDKAVHVAAQSKFLGVLRYKIQSTFSVKIAELLIKSSYSFSLVRFFSGQTWFMQTENRNRSSGKIHVLFCLWEIIKTLYFYISNSKLFYLSTASCETLANYHVIKTINMEMKYVEDMKFAWMTWGINIFLDCIDFDFLIWDKIFFHSQKSSHT